MMAPVRQCDRLTHASSFGVTNERQRNQEVGFLRFLRVALGGRHPKRFAGITYTHHNREIVVIFIF